jgi:hypothetical protein
LYQVYRKFAQILFACITGPNLAGIALASFGRY